jgi:hypothetical protein
MEGIDEIPQVSYTGKCKAKDTPTNKLTSDAPADPDEAGESYKDGDIHIDYHPNSGQASRVFSSKEYKADMDGRSQCATMPPPEENPWLPFSSREDFEFAEVVHDAKLNKKQIKKLIDIIHRCKKNPEAFTLRDTDELQTSLDDTSKLLTTVTTISSLS